MKIYEIWIIMANTTHTFNIEANRFKSSEGSHDFYLDDELIGCFPINRTVIRSIKNKD
jgi:hypothetical protein